VGKIMTKVYLANFGVGNSEWEKCRERGTIAIMLEVGVLPFYQHKDREGFTKWALENNVKSTKGKATEWYNNIEKVVNTSGDVWLHRVGNELWWTVSTSEVPDFYQLPDDPSRLPELQLYVYHKPCQPWSKLLLKSPVPKFLWTLRTLHQLSADNAAYICGLIKGDNPHPKA
jgi:hypothetical protein